MKIRQGFVTNSSSSSYLIAYKKNELLEEAEKCNSELLKKMISSLTSYIEKHFKHFNSIESIKEYYGIEEDDDDIKDFFGDESFIDEKKEYINKGYNMFIVEIPYGNDCDVNILEFITNSTDIFENIGGI